MRRLLTFAALAALPSSAVAAPDYVGEWGAQGTGSGQFLFPTGIATGSDGSVYVCDPANQRVQKFGPDGTFLLEWTTLDRDGRPTRSSRPRVDASGLVYVTGVDEGSIQVYTPGGTLVRRWGVQGYAPGQLANPIDVLIHATGDVFVSDFGRKWILRFHSDGTFVSEFPVEGGSPHGLAVDAGGVLFVTVLNCCVAKFAENGTPLGRWGTFGSGPGQFSNNTGIVVDADGDVLVTDGFNNRVQEFRPCGTFMDTWGVFGSGPGQLIHPDGIAIVPDGTIYVLDQNNHRVQMFRETSTEVLLTSWGMLKTRYR